MQRRGLILLVAGLLAGATARAADEKTVLTIYPESRTLPVVSTLDQAIRTTLQSRSAAPIRFQTEYLDLSWFGGPQAETLIARLMKEKYAGRNIDLIMPCGEAAIRFVLRERSSIFPGIPVVFCTADRDAMREVALAPDVTGVTMMLNWEPAVELIVRLHPGTRRVVLIGGSGPTAREWEDQARRAFARHAGPLEFTYLSGLAMPDVLKAVAALPQGTVALFNSFISDRAGRTFTTPEAVAEVAAVSPVPIYSISESLLGHGIVGGPMIDFRAQGFQAAELAWRVLSGQHLGPADVVAEHTAKYVFDARQLKRWGIDEKRLPPGSTVRFGQLSTWDQYKWHIVGALAFFALQMVLIVGLLVERRQRRWAERELDERLRFETLLSDLAVAFIKIRGDGVDRQIDEGLRRVVEELNVDRATVGEFASDGGQIRIVHTWARPDVASIGSVLQTRDLPWTISQIRSGRVVAISSLDDFPEAAEVDRRNIAALRIRSFALVPFVVEESVGGVLACSLLRDERSWPGELLQRMRVLAEIFAIVLWRRRAQRALEESEGRFRLMANAAPVMIWVAGPDGLCTDFNRAWLEFTGRTLAQEIGDGWADGVHPEDRDRCIGVYRQALAARRPFTVEYRLLRADGTYRTMLDNGVPRFDADGATFSGYIGSAVDITDIKDAQRAIVESTALRSAILGSLYGAVVALDRDGAIVAVNEMWTRFAEENRADKSATGVGANYLSVCRRAAAAGDRHAEKALDAIESVLSGRVPRALLEYPCHSPTETRWFAMAVESFRRPEGGAVISHIDVTRRRQAEEEAERGRDELAHALRVATSGELATTLAHEINQPLTAIVSNAQAARRMIDASRLDREELKAALEDIAGDARRTADIIRHLRALFRKEVAERRPLDVNEVIADVTGLLGKDLERRRIHLYLELGEGLPRVLGDTIQLQQVFLNVLVNACDAMKDVDGVRELHIETAHREGGRIDIAVRDSGVGVKESELSHIFDRFVTTKPNGLGMGLAISRSIIESHGGRIWATRNEGRGLTLHTELPALSPQPEDVASAPERERLHQPRSSV